MPYSNEDYEFSNDKEVDMLLAELPIDLLLENIKEQINDPLSTNTDYLEVVTEKCSYLKEKYGENSDDIQSIDRTLRSFCTSVIMAIDNAYGLEFDYSGDDSTEYLVSSADALYNFLILRYKKNISSFIYKYINQNKKLIVENFANGSKKKDVTTNTTKKLVKNKDDIVILSNLSSIISNIMYLQIEPVDFMKYACSSDNYEGRLIRNMITNATLTGNFTLNYLSIIRNEYSDVLDEIQNEVRIKIINK